MKTRKIAMLMVFVLAMASLALGVSAADFPTKPIHIVNYVAAGGVVDVTTSKFVDIASKYKNAVFVVENKTGAGGLIAQEYILEQPADGYNIFAATSSNII